VKAISLNKDSQTEEDRLKQSQLKASGEIPDHIAIIMDGNGRWAKHKGNLRVYGHKVGVDSVRDITEACAQLGVEYLTLYAFSTENWKRPMHEVSALMQILIQTLRKEARKLNENDIRLTAIGQIERFPAKCRRELQEAMDMTKDNKRMELCLALSYSGRWDITQAVQKLAQKVAEGELKPEDITSGMIGANLSTGNEPDPDLIIRTSGEYRISNFLLWQLAYSEFYITETFWPEFRRDELYEAIASYQKRERRYGKISEQVSNNGSQVG
jgi:undecaprenyl diphosphate synthase